MASPVLSLLTVECSRFFGVCDSAILSLYRTPGEVYLCRTENYLAHSFGGSRTQGWQQLHGVGLAGEVASW